MNSHKPSFCSMPDNRKYSTINGIRNEIVFPGIMHHSKRKAMLSNFCGGFYDNCKIGAFEMDSIFCRRLVLMEAVSLKGKSVPCLTVVCVY